MAGIEKMVVPLAGRPLVMHSVVAFETCDLVDEIVVVTRADLVERVSSLVEGAGCTKVRAVVRGGATRSESSRHGIAALSKDVKTVLVHDGARPLVSDALIRRVVEAAMHGAVIPGVAPTSTIKLEAGGASAGTLDRERLREAQTPQGFPRELLARALAWAIKAPAPPTDEAACVEGLGERVAIVAGDRRNIKVTVPDDLAVAEALVSGGAPPRETRIGFGTDVHRLTEGRPLVLGCVEIEHPRGLDGHSDADVLAHAICDALLGAAASGDIGDHFPDSSPEWEGASGERLLRRTVEILVEFGYVPLNVDATVSAQAPRLAPHRQRMIDHIARALRLPGARVSVKFTTTEHLGFEGREEGISATAVAQIGRIPLIPNDA
jgi:2-C-methyl-D-erythritol 4-phosphate cytidylyltransferase/2-C-methyl-D-erythritol 2,4-cyclodiphosphate synthase